MNQTERWLREIFGNYLTEYSEMGKRGERVRFVIRSSTVTGSELRQLVDTFEDVGIQLGDPGEFYFHCVKERGT